MQKPNKTSNSTLTIYFGITVFLGTQSALATNPTIHNPDLSTKSGFKKFYQEVISAKQYEAFAIKKPYNPLPDAFPPDLSPAIIAQLKSRTRPVGAYQPVKIGSNQELLETLKKDPSILEIQNPWLAFQYPDVRLRLEGYNFRIKYPAFEDALTESVNTEEKRKAFLLDRNRPAGNGLLGVIEELPKPSLSNYKSLGKNSALLESHAAKALACGRIDPLHIRSCMKALDELLAFMAPTGSISAIPLVEKIFNDESYTDGIVHAALKMMDRVSDYKNTRVFPLGSDDLFQDLVSAFMETGNSNEIAIVKTWDVLGLVSTRGTNLHLLFPYASTTSSQRALVALETLMMGAGILDSLTAGTGKLYSLPKTVTTVANYGKTYHFWMSAYLTRMGVLEGHGRGAASAASLSEIGYQMFSETAGREGLFKELLAETKPDVITRKIQIDLAFGLAGAEFGALAGANRVTSDTLIDIDYAVKRMVEGGVPQGWTNFEKKVGKKIKPISYLAWFDQVHPITGLIAIRGRSCLGLFKRRTENISYVSTLSK